MNAVQYYVVPTVPVLFGIAVVTDVRYLKKRYGQFIPNYIVQLGRCSSVTAGM